jgi:hypothetical protein
MDQIDRTIQLSNAIAELLNGEEIDDVIPSLVMVLHHATVHSGIPANAIVKFVQKTFAIECGLEDKITKH